jgi:hypothetical protein
MLTAIMMTVTENSDNLATLGDTAGTEAGSISLLEMDTAMLSSVIDTLATDIGNAEDAAAANSMANEMNETKLTDLEESIGKLAVSSDFYFQNDLSIKFTGATGLLGAESSFCVPDGVYYEFYANLAAVPD